MDQTALLWILGGMNAVTWLLLGWIKMDQRAENKSLWIRADSHGHTIACDNSGCKPRTESVIVRRGEG